MLYPFGDHRYLVETPPSDDYFTDSAAFSLEERHSMVHMPSSNSLDKSFHVIVHSSDFKSLLKDVKFDHHQVSWETYKSSNDVLNRHDDDPKVMVIFDVTSTYFDKIHEHKDTIWADIIQDHFTSNRDAFEIVLFGKPKSHVELLKHIDSSVYFPEQHDLSSIIITIGDTGLYTKHCLFHSHHSNNHLTYDGKNGHSIIQHIKNYGHRDSKLVAYLSMSVPYGRVKLHTDFDDVPSGHGTHVSGAALGGITHDCKGTMAEEEIESNLSVLFLDFMDKDNFSQQRSGLIIPPLLKPLMQVSYESGSRVFSNSWGSNTAHYSYYGAEMDDFVYDHDDYTIVVANGNEGMGNKVSSVGSPANAKNVIAVGASMNSYESFKHLNPLYFHNRVNPVDMDHVMDNAFQYNYINLAGFSSRGPTADGRIKPDVVAPGEFILSSRSHGLNDSDMLYMRGTSQATPLVSRCVAIILNKLQKVHQMPNPSSALIKNILITTAETMTGTVQNFYINSESNKASAHLSKREIDIMDQGFGRVNLYPMLHNEVLLRDRLIVSEYSKPISMCYQATKRISPLSIGMVYSDPASFPGSRHILINKIKFQVIIWENTKEVLANKDPIAIYYGNHNVASPGDIVNNVQRIRIKYVNKNNYIRILISANGPLYPHGKQPISVVLDHKSSLQQDICYHECSLFDIGYFNHHKKITPCDPVFNRYGKSQSLSSKCFRHKSLTQQCVNGIYKNVAVKEKAYTAPQSNRKLLEQNKKVSKWYLLPFGIIMFTLASIFGRFVTKNERLLSNIDKKRKLYHTL